MVTQVTATYAEMCMWENLHSAYRRAARGKRSRRAAAAGAICISTPRS